MPVIRARGWVNAPVEKVYAFYDDPRNLVRLIPPPVKIEVLRVEPSPPQAGSVFEFRYGIGPVGGTWKVKVLERIENDRFVDTTLSGPMQCFNHTHSFRPAASGRGTWVEDEIDYHVGPDGALGWLVDAVVGLVMRSTFIVRHALQRRILEG